MKTLTLSLLLVLMFTATACESVDVADSKNNATADTGAGSSKGTLFDKSKSSSVNKNTLTGLWESDEVETIAGELYVTHRYQFSSKTVTLSNKCRYADGTILYAQVQGDLEYKTDSIYFVENVSDSTSLSTTDVVYTCPVQISQGNFSNRILEGYLVHKDVVYTKIAN